VFPGNLHPAVRPGGRGPDEGAGMSTSRSRVRPRGTLARWVAKIRAGRRTGTCRWFQRKVLTADSGADHNAGMPEIDPAAVIEAVARDPRLRAFTGERSRVG
jgi:hypothetical protein